MSIRPWQVAPSLLAADFSAFGDAVERCVGAGVEWFHFDVMDGHFVPNITFGHGVVAALRPLAPEAFFDVHLMVENPDRHLESIAGAGANAITVHAEVASHLQRSLSAIRGLGCQAGVALNPSTGLESLRYVLDVVDLVLVMTVNPGFGGQAFLPSAARKVAELSALREREGVDFRIVVDGGVDPSTAPGLLRDGADVLVAGSFVFGHAGGLEGGLAALRGCLGGGQSLP